MKMSICKDLLKEDLLKEPDSECWRDQTHFPFVKCISCLTAWFQLTNSNLN